MYSANGSQSWDLSHKWNHTATETNKSYPGAFRPHFDFVNLKISLVCFNVFFLKSDQLNKCILSFFCEWVLALNQVSYTIFSVVYHFKSDVGEVTRCRGRGDCGCALNLFYREFVRQTTSGYFT